MMTTPVGKGVEDDGLGPSASSSAPDPEVLKRINQFRLGGRKESLTNIRAMNPDLSLSGNIISATFNIPYSLEYRKGADWVSNPFLLDYFFILRESQLHGLLFVCSLC